MTLNATLFVQMINFGITWMIVKYLFVHPVLRIRAQIRYSIEAVERERQALLEGLAQTHENRHKLWHNWYLQSSRAVIKNQPTASLYIPLMPSKTVAPEVPLNEIELLTDRLTEKVVAQLEQSV